MLKIKVHVKIKKTTKAKKNKMYKLAVAIE